MSIENGKCPGCGNALLLDSSKEKLVCKYCGHEVIIKEALQKVTVDGIVGFDTVMLKAQRALDFEGDFDKGKKYYREALELRPDNYGALWGYFLCEIASIRYARGFKGYVQIPGDIPENVQNAIRKYGNMAYNNAPEDIQPHYYREIQNVQNEFLNQSKAKKKGCYIATAVYGSYNCPEVWVLRRYRDEDLDSNFFGKMFIKMYYAISPTVVKLFGKRKWFNTYWRKRLDKKVARLKEKGYADTPYNDKY